MASHLYQQALMAHYKAPQNVGDILAADRIGEGFNANCGDKLKLGLWLADGRLSLIRYQIRACAICTASTSILSVQLTGQAIDNACRISEQLLQAVQGKADWPEGTAALSLAATSINRHRCITLGWQTCLQALNDRKSSAAMAEHTY